MLALILSAAADSHWDLVGVYDASAVRALNPEATPAMVWQPAPGMSSSCGRAKGPSGLGLFEAESMSNGLSPTLVVLLRTHENLFLTRDQVRLTIGDPSKNPHLLEAAVEPRRLRLTMETTEDGSAAMLQLIRTQVEIALCLEHKVARGWIGGEVQQVRQALLLTAPEPSGAAGDRVYFLGQSAPVPALIGPPDACIVAQDNPQASVSSTVDTLDMVPIDIWASHLRVCDASEGTANPTEGWMPLRASSPLKYLPGQRTWMDVGIRVSKEAIALSYGNAPTQNIALESNTLEQSGNAAIADIIGNLPYRYPMFQSGDYNYTILMVPSWQIDEALRSDGADLPNSSSLSTPAAATDALGWLLEHPEYLHIQIVDGQTKDNSVADLASSLGGSLGPRSWGYTVGYEVAREPLAIPSSVDVTSDQVASANRWTQHGLFLASAGILLALTVTGLRRLPDLWSRVPEERADYWPGSTGTEEAKEVEGPDMNVAGES
jgi:hypothetical protein